MNEKNFITAISFFYEGERVKISANKFGKFKVPVSSNEDGRLKTSNKFLTANETITHDIIKKCDPTLYLQTGERIRVYTGGDHTYLPALTEGLLQKHDDLNKSKTKILKGKNTSKTSTYEQMSGILYSDMHSWYDDHDYAD